MADVADPIDSTTPAEVSNGGGAAISDPRLARMAELEEYARAAHNRLQQLEPLAEDIEALEKDESYREFVRSSRKSYQQMLEEQRRAEDEALSPDGRRLLAEIETRLKPALEEVNVLRTERESRTAAQAAAAKEASEKFQRENLEYAQRLVAEQKLTSEEILELSRYAKVLHDDLVAKGEPRFVPLEEAYKRLYGRAEARASAPVPKSLRAKSGAPGVPGASKAPPGERIDPTRPGSFTNEMLKRLNTQRKTG
jgi:hypothetical protein